MQTLQQVLQQHYYEFATILPADIQHGNTYLFDLSAKNSEFKDIDPNDTAALIKRTQEIMQNHHAILAVGKYNEIRALYSPREHYKNEPQKTLHIGMDLTAAADTSIHAPMDAIIHSFADNDAPGDYGPTIILQHKLDDKIFYTLYGHLNRHSLANIHAGQFIAKEQAFAAIGDHLENGHWPPHLHFQIIADLGNYHGTYPGVVDPMEASFYLQNCPDPNLILNLAF